MTRPRITFPDAEAIVVDYLRDQLATAGTTLAALGTRPPSPMATPAVQVRRSGGVRIDLVREQPRVDVVVWHDSDEQARDLAELCHALLWQMPGTSRVTNVGDFLGPTPFPDPDTGASRYMLTVELTTRGATS